MTADPILLRDIQASAARKGGQVQDQLLDYIATDPACLTAWRGVDDEDLYIQLAEVMTIEEQWMEVDLLGTRRGRTRVPLPVDVNAEDPLQPGERIWISCGVVATLAKAYEQLLPWSEAVKLFGEGIQYVREPKLTDLRGAIIEEMVGEVTDAPVQLEGLFDRL